jgi:hypothetical protein
MSKRGQANKVDEKWMSPCNKEGLSPFQNSARLNMKTISARQRERLEKKADESHGWELAGKHEEVRQLTAKLEARKSTNIYCRSRPSCYG